MAQLRVLCLFQKTVLQNPFLLDANYAFAEGDSSISILKSL